MKPRRFLSDAPGHNTGNDLLSHRIVAALPSAATGLTLVFGMGTGVSPRLYSPECNPQVSRSGTTVVCESLQ